MDDMRFLKSRVSSLETRLTVENNRHRALMEKCRNYFKYSGMNTSIINHLKEHFHRDLT